MIAEINEFSVFGDMLRAMGQTVPESWAGNGNWAIADRGGLQEDWKSTSAYDLGVSSADRRRTAADPTGTEVQYYEELGRRWPTV